MPILSFPWPAIGRKSNAKGSRVLHLCTIALRRNDSGRHARRRQARRRSGEAAPQTRLRRHRQAPKARTRDGRTLFEQFSVGNLRSRDQRTAPHGQYLFSALTYNPAACTSITIRQIDRIGKPLRLDLHPGLIIGLSVQDTTWGRRSETSAWKTPASAPGFAGDTCGGDQGSGAARE